MEIEGFEHLYRSLSPMGKTVPKASARLLNPGNTREHTVVACWTKRNIPAFNGQIVPVQAILGITENDEPAKRDIEVMAATIQWLGTHVGAGFLRNIVTAAEAAEVPFYELEQKQ